MNLFNISISGDYSSHDDLKIRTNYNRHTDPYITHIWYLRVIYQTYYYIGVNINLRSSKLQFLENRKIHHEERLSPYMIHKYKCNTKANPRFSVTYTTSSVIFLGSRSVDVISSCDDWPKSMHDNRNNLQAHNERGLATFYRNTNPFVIHRAVKSILASGSRLVLF